MCKPERTMSELMQAACKEAESVKEKLKCIGNTFLKCREVSQHEAIARLISMPLRESNVEVLFVPTDYENERTRILKPAVQLQNMNANDSNVFVENKLDLYSCRSANANNMCLAVFAAWYKRKKTFVANDNADEEHSEEEDCHENVSTSDASSDYPSVIVLGNSFGYMCKRYVQKVIRNCDQI